MPKRMTALEVIIWIAALAALVVYMYMTEVM